MLAFDPNRLPKFLSLLLLTLCLTLTSPFDVAADESTDKDAPAAKTLHGKKAAAMLSLTSQSASSHTGLPIALVVTVQNAAGSTVSAGKFTLALSVAGASGSFTPKSTLTTENGVAYASFTATSSGIATVTVSAPGLASAALTISIQDINIATHHYDNLRTGWNPSTPTLSPAIVAQGSFTLLSKVPLDDQIDAQPLFVSAQRITNRGLHNVVYVATESNSIYAIDAPSGEILLKSSLGSPVPQSMLPGECNNNTDHVGINSTPAIDLQSQTLYVISYTLEQGSPVYRLHALSLSDLTDKTPSVVVEASHKLADNNLFNFSARTARLRAALTVNSGNVYAAFGSFCDIEANNSRGWVLGWTADSLAALPANRLNDTQATSPSNYFLSSIWM